MKPEWVRQLERDGVNRYWSFQHPELSLKKGSPLYVCGLCDRIEFRGMTDGIAEFSLRMRGTSGKVVTVSNLATYAQRFETEKEALEDAAMKNKARCLTK